MPVLPFNIGDMRFVHTQGDDELNKLASDYFNKQANLAVFKWRRENEYTCCSIIERTLIFAVFVDDEFFGTWGLYRVRPVADDPNIVTALPAPMFHDIGVATVLETHEGESQGDREKREAASRVWWRRVNRVMEHFLDNTLPMTEGGTFEVQSFRFPNTADRDPLQHEWRGHEEAFAQDSKKVHRADSDGTLRELKREARRDL